MINTTFQLPHDFTVRQTSGTYQKQIPPSLAILHPNTARQIISASKRLEQATLPILRKAPLSLRAQKKQTLKEEVKAKISSYVAALELAIIAHFQDENASTDSCINDSDYIVRRLQKLKNKWLSTLACTTDSPLIVETQASNELLTFVKDDLYRELLSEQTDKLTELFSKRCPDSLETYEILLHSITRQRLQELSSAMLAPENIAALFHSLKEKVGEQFAVVRSFYWHTRKRPPIDGNLILQEGICFGTSLIHASRRLRGSPSHISMRPSAPARFFQSLNDLESSYSSNTKNEVETEAEDILKSESVQLHNYPSLGVQLKKISVREVELQEVISHLFFLKERCEQAMSHMTGINQPHIILGICTYDTYTKFANIDALSLEFYERILKLANQESVFVASTTMQRPKRALLRAFNAFHSKLQDDTRHVLAEAFEKEFPCLAAKHSHRRIGEDAPLPVHNRITASIENILRHKLKTFCYESIKTDNVHAVYLKLTAPFELRDPNYPDFTLFQTTDFTEFMLYFISWFVHGGFTHCMDADLVLQTTSAFPKSCSRFSNFLNEVQQQIHV